MERVDAGGDGILFKHTRATAAVAEAENCRINVEIDVSARLEVNIVGYGGYIRCRIWQGGCREKIPCGDHPDAMATAVEERELGYRFMIARVLRTRIVGVLSVDTGTPTSDRSGIVAVGICLHRAVAIPVEAVILFAGHKGHAQTRKLGQRSLAGVGLVEIDSPVAIEGVAAGHYDLSGNISIALHGVDLYFSGCFLLEIERDKFHLGRVYAVFGPILGEPVAKALVIVSRSAEGLEILT